MPFAVASATLCSFISNSLWSRQQLFAVASVTLCGGVSSSLRLRQYLGGCVSKLPLLGGRASRKDIDATFRAYFNLVFLYETHDASCRLNPVAKGTCEVFNFVSRGVLARVMIGRQVFTLFNCKLLHVWPSTMIKFLLLGQRPQIHEIQAKDK